MYYSDTRLKKYLNRYIDLPGGTTLYQISSSGRVFVTGNGALHTLTKDDPLFKDSLHTFINPGNLAHYLLGNPKTSPNNPSNATIKVSLTTPHHSFQPHVHGSEHFVKSEGFSGCILFDHKIKKAVIVKLIPGSLIHIPAMVPHAFYNRANVPLVTLIANGGLGIDHEDYAITKTMAQKRLKSLTGLQNKQELEELIQSLNQVECLFNVARPEYDLNLNERAALTLYTLAEYFSAH